MKGVKDMLIDIGNKYENLVENEDYLDIIREKISHEFANEIQLLIDEAHIIEKIHERAADSDAAYIEAENEELRRTIDDINAELQQFIVPIEKGQRLNREKTIKLINRIIEK